MEAGLLLPSSSLSQVILTQDDLKKIAAYKVVEYVESGMVLGLGTGSTAKHAVDRIGELLRQGKLKDIVGIPTSKKTHEQALSLGIPLSVEGIQFCWKFTASRLQKLFGGVWLGVMIKYFQAL